MDGIWTMALCLLSVDAIVLIFGWFVLRKEKEEQKSGTVNFFTKS